MLPVVHGGPLLRSSRICPCGSGLRSDGHHVIFFAALCCWAFHLTMVEYHPRRMKRAMRRITPPKSTSESAARTEFAGAAPGDVRERMSPSWLQVTRNCPDLMPSRAFLTTSSTSIIVEEDDRILVSSGLLFTSAIGESQG